MDLSIENVERCMKYNNAEERDVLKQYFTNPSSIDRRKKTFVFSTPSETGTSFFRIFEPMRVMWKHLKDEANFIYTENLQPNHLKLADAIIMHRAGNLHSHFVSVSQMWPQTEQKPLIVHDVDDNEFNLPKTHPMRELWYASGKDKMSIQTIKHSEFVCTTTEKLYKTFKFLNNEVYVVRNMFDWDLPQWNLDKEVTRKEMLGDWYPTDDKIIIGWAGLTSHYEDIKRMHGVIKKIHDKYPNTYFVLAGMALKDSSIEIQYDEDNKPMFKEKEIEDESMLYKNRVKSLYSDIDTNRLKIFDALPLELYGKFYSLFDISLAYIEHNAFNSCKSEIKAIESLHYNCIPVFSLYGGYKDFWDAVPREIKQDKMAIVSMMPKQWIEAVSHWVDELNKGIEDGVKPVDTIVKVTDDITCFTDERYNLNDDAENRLMFLLEKTEAFQESEVNRIARDFGDLKQVM